MQTPNQSQMNNAEIPIDDWDTDYDGRPISRSDPTFDRPVQRLMMLNKFRQVSGLDIFQLPCAMGCQTARDIALEYPLFVESMHGREAEACLLWYYSLNPVSSVWTFRDPDSEMRIADILGIDISVCVDGESIEEGNRRRALEVKLKPQLRTAKDHFPRGRLAFPAYVALGHLPGWHPGPLRLHIARRFGFLRRWL